MKEYIERGELESILHNRYDRLAGLRPDFYAGYMMAFHTIEDDVPTAADVAPVIHCKDCVYAHPLKDSKYDYLCHYWNGHSCNQNQFCSQGKRKEDEK